MFSRRTLYRQAPKVGNGPFACLGRPRTRTEWRKYSGKRKKVASKSTLQNRVDLWGGADAERRIFARPDANSQSANSGREHTDSAGPQDSATAGQTGRDPEGTDRTEAGQHTTARDHSHHNVEGLYAYACTCDCARAGGRRCRC